MTYIIQGNTGQWELVIGLEVHAQITSKSKLFSGAPTDFGKDPNHNVALVDAAMPGMLPVINRECVRQAIKTGLGLKAQINRRSVFDRKNYFYPDLPQGYQISQYLDPIVGKGVMTIELADGSTRDIGITRLHLEQDAGKSLHEHSPDSSFIDLNRAGIALMEIVSEPDMRTPEEAGAYVKKLRSIVRYLGTCDGDMEKGSMRCDANVSVRRVGVKEFGTRCEIKNVNSMRNLMRAIEYEAQRQVEILEAGGMIDQETRLYDAGANETRTMRSKEDAHDYRYFPDPDLLPLELSEALIAEIEAELPELPDDKKARYIRDFGLNAYDAGVITSDKANADYFEAVLAEGADARLATTWMTAELFGRLNKIEKSIEESPVSPKALAGLIGLIHSNEINGKIAKDVLDDMIATGKDAAAIVSEKGLKQVTDDGAIRAIIQQVMDTNPDKVGEFKSGKDKLFGFFVGQVMKESKGQANPAMVNDLLKEMLG
jgi:aspartyl-tRNA(Asn)/glutamyl-tRNA(Gln) amidotransferase subunit B